MSTHQNRCRLVLIAPDIADADQLAGILKAALAGGDVATVILAQRKMDEQSFQKACEAAMPVIHAAGAAVLVAGDSRIVGRVRADGLHVEGNAAAVAEAVERYAPGIMVGGGNARDRHTALAIGESQPDYVFFGGLDGDIKPEPHSKNLALAEWWADIIAIPCVLMGGSDPSHALEMAETGAEFIAFGKAVFDTPEEAGRIVAEINAALDEKAPRFDR
ncbi:thiamine-phosphate diphosphorylase [Hoeflea marina]|uniref:Thiamine-phosphate diphosphorylase n=1 Tax=Hoeflea marina TaxID=274592 RepID=A0A317PDI7_9HYPH|nr:thiamine phosphate synthase [Hoeflea marina]PWV97252.1 thiamine-phosphate diphosphorylase [Hoeflea marina]